METAEPVFGQIKQGRGFRQFLLRGLEKVNREWQLIYTGHNLLKLFRFWGRTPSRELAGNLGQTASATAAAPTGERSRHHSVPPARLVAG